MFGWRVQRVARGARKKRKFLRQERGGRAVQGHFVDGGGRGGSVGLGEALHQVRDLGRERGALCRRQSRLARGLPARRIDELAAHAQGEVEVVVKAADTISDPVKVKLDPFAPGVFTHDGKFVVLTRGEDKPIDRPEQIPAKDKEAATAKAGEKITLYGTGLGATDPETPAGRLADAEAKTKAPVTVNIGGTDAVVEFAGIRPGSAAIYQIVVTVPEGLTDGDHRVTIQAQDIKSPEAEGCCFLKVKN